MRALKHLPFALAVVAILIFALTSVALAAPNWPRFPTEGEIRSARDEFVRNWSENTGVGILGIAKVDGKVDIIEILKRQNAKANQTEENAHRYAYIFIVYKETLSYEYPAKELNKTVEELRVKSLLYYNGKQFACDPGPALSIPEGSTADDAIRTGYGNLKKGWPEEAKRHSGGRFKGATATARAGRDKNVPPGIGGIGAIPGPADLFQTIVGILAPGLIAIIGGLITSAAGGGGGSGPLPPGLELPPEAPPRLDPAGGRGRKPSAEEEAAAKEKKRDSEEYYKKARRAHLRDMMKRAEQMRERAGEGQTTGAILGATVDNALKDVNEARDTIGESFVSTGKSINKAAEAVSETGKKVAEDAVEAGRDIAKDPSLVSETLKGSFHTASDALSSAFKAVTGTSKDLMEAAKDFFGDSEIRNGTIGGTALDIWNLLGRTKDGVSDAFDAVKSFVSDPRKMWDAFRNLSGIENFENALDPNRSLISRIGQIGLGTLNLYGSITFAETIGSAAKKGITKLLSGSTDDALKAGARKEAKGAADLSSRTKRTTEKVDDAAPKTKAKPAETAGAGKKIPDAQEYKDYIKNAEKKVERINETVSKGVQPDAGQIADNLADPAGMRRLKDAPGETRAAFNEAANKQIFEPADNAVLDKLKKADPGGEYRTETIRTPGKAIDPADINTDRDVRVLKKFISEDGEEVWREVPRGKWEDDYFEAFAENTGFSSEKAKERFPEISWDKMNSKEQLKKWGDIHNQTPTDVYHPEGARAFSDQPTAMAPGSAKQGTTSAGEAMQGRGRIVDAEGLGDMEKYKVDNYWNKGTVENRTEALEQLAKKGDLAEKLAKGYNVKGLPDSMKEALKVIKDRNLSPGERDAAVRALGFRNGVLELSDKLSSRIGALAIAKK